MGGRAERSCRGAAEVLVEADADMDKATTSGETPAFVAVQEGHAEALQVLVKAGADLDEATTSRATPAFIWPRRRATLRSCRCWWRQTPTWTRQGQPMG